jgi:RimJ/RimL family protein N-acetyltransferase
VFPCTRLAKDGRLIIVRPVEIGDATSIIANINVITAEEIYLQTDSFIQTPSWQAALRDSNDPQAGLLLIVPILDRAVIGHLRVFPGDYGARDRHVGSIGVALLPPYRSVGIGTALLGCALDWILHAGFEKLEAYVIASNLRARRLFEKFGFAIEGVRQQQLRIRDRYEDELILARPVQAACKQSPIYASRQSVVLREGL